MAAFEQLQRVCRFGYATRFVDRVEAWSRKRQALSVQLRDLPVLVEQWKNRRTWVDPVSPEITMRDPIPDLRLANAFESSANALYAAAEVAAGTANLITGFVPRSFNELQKKAEKGALPPELVQALGDLQWYRTVREMRTEWTHYSTVFVGGTSEPDICIFGFRGKDNRAHLDERHVCSPPEFIDWIERALRTLDSLAAYLLRFHVLPGHEAKLDMVINSFVLDPNGFPKIRDGRLEPREITVRDLLIEHGLVKGRDYQRTCQHRGGGICAQPSYADGRIRGSVTAKVVRS